MKRTLALILALVLALSVPVLAAEVVVRSDWRLVVDGRTVNCDSYNIDGSNYYKLRDLAAALDGTESGFSVDYLAGPGIVSVTPGRAYTYVGGELVSGGEDLSATAVVTPQNIMIDGMRAVDISVYNIGGNNYFKLRDLKDYIGFGVDYDAAARLAIVTSGTVRPDPLPTGQPAPTPTAQPTPTPTVQPTPTPTARPEPTPAGRRELSAEEIYAVCAPAVFYLEIRDARGRLTKTGSGFFLTEDGVAVTNYHVISGAASARAVLTDGTEHAVLGVSASSAAEDWAVLEIEGSGFTALPAGGQDTIVGGATVYAIGSPLGLQNSISEGLISNPAREEGGVTYIQTTADISPGSSGGALINKYGEAIGITRSGYEEGNSLYLAVPLSYVGYGGSGGASAPETAGSASGNNTMSLSTDTVALSRWDAPRAVRIYSDCDVGCTVRCASANKDVATCGWGVEDFDTDYIDLWITPVAAGTTEITVQLLSAAGAVLDEKTVSVTVL